MKKILLVVLFLIPSLELNANAWCIPKPHRRNEEIDNQSDSKEKRFLEIYHGDCGQDAEKAFDREDFNPYQAATNDDEVANLCKENSARGGCFKKNKHGQLFCKDYKDHHGKALEGGSCEE